MLRVLYADSLDAIIAIILEKSNNYKFKSVEQFWKKGVIWEHLLDDELKYKYLIIPSFGLERDTQKKLIIS